MAKKLSFDAYLGWVNITNPNQIPADARVIGANDLLRYEKLGKDTAEKFAEVDSTLDGMKSDTVISDLIADAKSETRYAVDAMVKSSVTTGVAKFQKVIDEVPGKVTAQVAEVIAADGTVAAAAGTAARNAVETELLNKGVVTGRHSSVLEGDFAWRQTTDDGYYLPLGYTSDGGLDPFARKIWLRDINHAEEVEVHPYYARVIATENNDVLFGIRWDGSVEIPGLIGGGGGGQGSPAAPAVLYNDSPYVPDSDIMPGHANPRSWSMWGSSSAGGVAGEMQKAATARGAKFYNGGVGWEGSYHIAARLGSVPAELTFPSNSVPASGSVAVTVPNSTYLQYAASYAGYVTAEDGTRIKGTLAPDTVNSLIKFTRTTSGNAAKIQPGAPFIPDAGLAHRGDTTFLWMGKNNSWDTGRVIRETDASFNYLAPLVKRCAVLGHFVNTNASASARAQIKTINDAYAARYGDAYVDVNAYLTGARVWQDTGLTPTQADAEQQSLGNKPPSLSRDDGHLNDVANKAVVHSLLMPHIEALGWHTPANV